MSDRMNVCRERTRACVVCCLFLTLLHEFGSLNTHTQPASKITFKLKTNLVFGIIVIPLFIYVIRYKCFYNGIILKEKTFPIT